jgi:hypothetical protein
LPFRDGDSGTDPGTSVTSALGFPDTVISSPSSPPTLGTAPIVSSTPNPGQGVATDSGGDLPVSVAAQSVPLTPADPTSPAIGQIWYRTDLSQFRIYDGSTKALTFTTGGYSVGAYAAYTPVWTTSGVAPALSNGVLTGKYVQIGKQVIGNIHFAAGAGTTFGTGTYSFSLPVTSVAVSSFFVIGNGYIYDSSANSLWTGMAFHASTTTVQLDITGAAGAYALSNANPFAWATSDEVNIHFAYEAA